MFEQSHVITSSGQVGKGHERKKREKKKELGKVLLVFARGILVADWSTHYAAIKGRGTHCGLVDSLTGVALVVGSGRLND